MEFGEKLQDLRKNRGLTQESLAEALFVSRTAISKWESGRGYPNIESLRALSKFFGITLDDLLSGDELLRAAEEDSEKKRGRICDIVFGLLDISVAMLLFLPFFAQRTAEALESRALLSLDAANLCLIALYFVFVALLVSWGVFTLAMQSCESKTWAKIKKKVSLTLSLSFLALLVISSQPYAAIFTLFILAIKIGLLLTRRVSQV